MRRKVVRSEANYTLKEPQIPYDTLFTPEIVALSLKNTYSWDVFTDITYTRLTWSDPVWVENILDIRKLQS